jgi:putative solute:sodium symporter small subunit
MSATTIKAAPPAEGAKTESPPKLSYWAENLRLLGILLTIWFTVSFGFGILLRDTLDSFSILGVPAGFWFAQQGAIYVFIGLIFYYARAIQKIERKHGVDDDEEAGQ